MSKSSVYRWLNPLLLWRLRHVSERVYVIWLSVLVGGLAGLAAVLLKTSVHWGQGLLQNGISEPQRVFVVRTNP